MTETAERIDIEKLKAREHILFFDEVLLFEDELHDHGVSMLSVKIVSVVCLWDCLYYGKGGIQPQNIKGCNSIENAGTSIATLTLTFIGLQTA